MCCGLLIMMRFLPVSEQNRGRMEVVWGTRGEVGEGNGEEEGENKKNRILKCEIG